MAGVLAMILAGGEGTRLQPLTNTRSKPAVPFGGSYRLVDFVLNNFVNSDILRIFVLTQFKSQSLYLHMKKAWVINGIPGCFIDQIPAQMRMGKRWYDGTADAIYQNIGFVEASQPEHICVFGSDHVYKMDIRQMIDFHKSKKAALTVSAIRVPIKKARAFGIIEVDENNRMIGFEEKPICPKSIPGDPEHALASMGNYVFNTETLYDVLKEDSENNSSTHDFARDIIPNLFPKAPVYVYDFSTNRIANEKNVGYWRDVGSIDSYWQTSMDLLEDNPKFSLFNPSWPLHTFYPPLPPAMYMDSKNCKNNITHSMVAAGSLIEGANISKSILGFNCHLSAGTEISQSILLGEVSIGANCRIHRAIIDKDVKIAPGVVIGENFEHDKHLYTMSDGGIIVIPKGARIGF